MTQDICVLGTGNSREGSISDGGETEGERLGWQSLCWLPQTTMDLDEDCHSQPGP